MGIGLAHDYRLFLIFQLAIGAIGASFVVTQFHTSVMFAPNIVGTANATAAGWGNLGGGVTQFAVPLLFSAFMSYGVGSLWSWRLAMLTAGIALLVTGVAYYFLTEDTADGDWRALQREQASLQVIGAPNAFWKLVAIPVCGCWHCSTGRRLGSNRQLIILLRFIAPTISTFR
jgi:nitrate/nitrite transporter NarK